MSFVFINLAVRFVLEMIAFVAFGMWGWNNTEGWMRYVAAIALPVLASTIWGVFNVPGDPRRSGNAPVVVPGGSTINNRSMFLHRRGMGTDVPWLYYAWKNFYRGRNSSLPGFVQQDHLAVESQGA